MVEEALIEMYPAGVSVSRVVRTFLARGSVLKLVAVRLRHVEGEKWGLVRYLKMDYLRAESRHQEEIMAG